MAGTCAHAETAPTVYEIRDVAGPEEIDAQAHVFSAPKVEHARASVAWNEVRNTCSAFCTASPVADRSVAAWSAANPASLRPKLAHAAIQAHSAEIYFAARGFLGYTSPEVRTRAAGTPVEDFNRRFPEPHLAAPANYETSRIDDAGVSLWPRTLLSDDGRNRRDRL